jgi:hypothetical protein
VIFRQPSTESQSEFAMQRGVIHRFAQIFAD